MLLFEYSDLLPAYCYIVAQGQLQMRTPEYLEAKSGFTDRVAHASTRTDSQAEGFVQKPSEISSMEKLLFSMAIKVRKRWR